MDNLTYTSLADQVARQTPELAAHDADIAALQPTVDTLTTAVTTAQAALDAAAEADKQAAQAVLDAARQALAGPANELADLKARATAISASIAQCQAAMTASGLVLTTADMDAQRLAEVKALMTDRIKAKRDLLSSTGGYTTFGKWFHSDEKSKTQQLALFIMGSNVPAVPWKTMDSTFITMSQALAGSIFQAAAAQDMAIFSTAETHITAMLASATPLTYDFSGGWPATFPGVA